MEKFLALTLVALRAAKTIWSFGVLSAIGLIIVLRKANVKKGKRKN